MQSVGQRRVLRLHSLQSLSRLLDVTQPLPLSWLYAQLLKPVGVYTQSALDCAMVVPSVWTPTRWSRLEPTGLGPRPEYAVLDELAVIHGPVVKTVSNASTVNAGAFSLFMIGALPTDLSKLRNRCLAYVNTEAWHTL